MGRGLDSLMGLTLLVCLNPVCARTAEDNAGGSDRPLNRCLNAHKTQITDNDDILHFM